MITCRSLNDETEARLYSDALVALVLMQSRIRTDDIPDYDAVTLNAEMELFPVWFLNQLLDIGLDQQQITSWQAAVQILTDCALEQPRVFVHRDYHSRNLMEIDS